MGSRKFFRAFPILINCGASPLTNIIGDIDLYPEYTGTITQELLSGKSSDWRKELESRGILATEPLGFNNTYALAMKRSLAEKLGIRSISDLKNHPQLAYGFSNEFLNRNDGWQG